MTIEKGNLQPTVEPMTEYNLLESEERKHHDPQVIGGNMQARDVRGVIAEFNTARHFCPGIRDTFAHFSLRVHPNDTERWCADDYALAKAYLEDYMREMCKVRNPNFKKDGQKWMPSMPAKWLVIAHDKDHIHVEYLRADEQGRTITDSLLKTRANLMTLKLDDKYGLTPYRTPKSKPRQQPRMTRGEQAKEKRTGTPSTKTRISEAIHMAIPASGGDWGRFNAFLQEQGIEMELLRHKNNGQIYGCRFRESASNVWFKGSAVGFKVNELKESISHEKTVTLLQRIAHAMRIIAANLQMWVTHVIPRVKSKYATDIKQEE